MTQLLRHGRDTTVFYKMSLPADILQYFSHRSHFEATRQQTWLLLRPRSAPWLGLSRTRRETTIWIATFFKKCKSNPRQQKQETHASLKLPKGLQVGRDSTAHAHITNFFSAIVSLLQTKFSASFYVLCMWVNDHIQQVFFLSPRGSEEQTKDQKQ